MKKTALVIVDPQNDFMVGGSLPAGGEEIIDKINRLRTREFVKVVISLDWHPPDHHSFAVNHQGAAPFTSQVINGTLWELWPKHCVAHSVGAALNSSLQRKADDLLVLKGLDPAKECYSAFCKVPGSANVDLERQLRALEINRIVVCGFAFDFCVANTALDGAKSGFSVVVVEDCCGAVAEKSSKEMKSKMKEAGVKIVSNTELLEM